MTKGSNISFGLFDLDLKPLSEEVTEASSLRLLGAENENAELRKRLENLQAEQEVSSQGCFTSFIISYIQTMTKLSCSSCRLNTGTPLR